MAEVDEKRSNRVLVGVLLVLALVIVGLGTGIVIVNMRGKDEVAVPEEKWGEAVGKCVSDFNTTAVDCLSFENELKELSETSDDENTRIMAGINLSALYVRSDAASAINLLENMYDDGLSDNNKYYLLSTLIFYYKDSGDEVNYIKKMQEIVELPDSMELEREDWKMVKRMFVLELDSIEESKVDYEV